MRDGWEGGAHRGVLTVPTCGAHLGGSYVMIMIMILIYGTASTVYIRMSLIFVTFIWNKRCFS